MKEKQKIIIKSAFGAHQHEIENKQKESAGSGT